MTDGVGGDGGAGMGVARIVIRRANEVESRARSGTPAGGVVMRCIRMLVISLALLGGSVAAVAAQGGNLGVAQVTGYPELKVTVGDHGITARRGSRAGGCTTS